MLKHFSSYYTCFLTGLQHEVGGQLYEDFAGSKCWQVFPDVVPSLVRLKTAGVSVGVISNFDDRLCA